MSVIRILFLACFLVLGPAVSPQVQGADNAPLAPALWQLKHEKSGAGATLFGTIHSLPHGTSWLKPHVVQALDAADELILEAMVPDDPATMAAIIERLALLPAPRPVASRLSEGWRATYARATTRLNSGNLDRYESWFVALTLANLQAEADGFDPRIGADAVLSERARMRGLPIHTLETIEQQLGYFDILTEADQQQLLIAILTGLDGTSAHSASLLADWLAGATERLAATMNAEFASVPMLRRILVEDRNKRWAAWLDSELQKGPAQLFVAVGAGHLAGPGSLVTELERRGYKVERVMPPPKPKPKPKQQRRRRR